MSGTDKGAEAKAEASTAAASDLRLLKKAEAVLAEIDRTAGLIDAHADVLAALRIRIEGGPRKSLEALLDAAGDIRGQKARELEEKLAAEESRKPKGDLSDLMGKERKPKKSLDDLLGGG
ncbi:MAG: hypothetical protein WD826_09480 [Actinomycetota bacterium]